MSWQVLRHKVRDIETNMVLPDSLLSVGGNGFGKF